jgi:hypothetical protein
MLALLGDKNLKYIVLIFCLLISIGCAAKNQCELFIDKWSKNSSELRIQESFLDMSLAFNEKYGSVEVILDEIGRSAISESKFEDLIESHSLYLLNQAIVKKNNKAIRVLLDKRISIYEKNNLMNAPILEFALNKDEEQLNILNSYLNKQIMIKVRYFVQNCKGQLKHY